MGIAIFQDYIVTPIKYWSKTEGTCRLTMFLINKKVLTCEKHLSAVAKSSGFQVSSYYRTLLLLT